MPRGRRQETRRQIGLVENVDARGPGRQMGERLDNLIGFEHGEHHVGALELVLGTRDAEAFDLVRGGAQARSVDEDYRHAADIERLAQRVARGAWNGRDDRALFARQAVHKT